MEKLETIEPEQKFSKLAQVGRLYIMFFSLSVLVIYFAYTIHYSLIVFTPSSLEGMAPGTLVFFAFFVLVSLSLLALNGFLFFAAFRINEVRSRRTHLGALYVCSFIWLLIFLYILSYAGGNFSFQVLWILLPAALLLIFFTMIIHVSLPKNKINSS